MKVGVLTTNHGPHPASKWAMQSVFQIMQALFSEDAASSSGARKLENAFLDVLETHHDKVQKAERAQLESKGSGRLLEALDPGEHAPPVIDDIIAAASKVGKITVPDQYTGDDMEVDVAKHLDDERRRKAIGDIVASHFATAMDIERSWHSDRNQDDPDCVAYRMARTNHGGLHAHAFLPHYRHGNVTPPDVGSPHPQPPVLQDDRSLPADAVEPAVASKQAPVHRAAAAARPASKGR